MFRLVMLSMYLPQRCHRHDGVPEGSRNGCEVRVLLVLLSVEHYCSEDYNRHSQREDQETQLTGARLQGVTQDSQPLRVPGELEDTEHSEHSQGHEGSGHVVVVRDPQTDVVRKDRHHVYDRHHRSNEFTTVWCSKESEQVFSGEYHNTRCI